jgi:adenosine deaminase
VTPADFQEALREGNLATLRRFPKADRHCHSILGASLQSIRAWAGEPVEPPPVRMASLDEMRKYSREKLYPFIRNERGVGFTARQTIEESIQDGVQILELSIDVNFISLFGSGVQGFLDLVGRLLSDFKGRIDFRPEVGVSRNNPPPPQIAAAMECINSGLFRSIDLYGNELAQPPEAYSALYDHAERRGLKLKAHAGEFAGPESIEGTLQVLHLHELQHGVTAALSRTVIAILAKERIRLNVCPSSNVALSVTEDMAHHQVRILVDNGVRVSINSDDKTIFGNTVTEEYLALSKAGTLSPEELDSIRNDSLTE